MDRNVTVLQDDGRPGDIQAGDTAATPDGPLAFVSEVEILAAGYDVPGAVHHWTFDSTGNDSGTSGSPITLTVSGYDVGHAPTKFANTASSYASITGSVPSLASAFSFSFWAKLGVNQTGGYFFAWQSFEINFTAYNSTSRIQVQNSGSSPTLVSNSNSIPNDGAWHHYAVLYDGLRAIFFVDGVFQGTDVGVIPLSSGVFGASSGNLLDEVRYYDRFLSVPQVSPFTLQGNEFNGNGQLIRLTADGQLKLSVVRTLTANLVFNSSTALALFTLPANATVHRVELVVDTAFDGGAYTSIGVSADHAKYTNTDHAFLGGIGTYETRPGLVADGTANAVVAYFTPGSGASVGAARIIFHYSVP